MTNIIHITASAMLIEAFFRKTHILPEVFCVLRKPRGATDHFCFSVFCFLLFNFLVFFFIHFGFSFLLFNFVVFHFANLGFCVFAFFI